MTLQINELGLPVTPGGEVLTNPIVLEYGPPDCGKSTDIARAFQNAYYILNDGGNLHAYSQWRADHPQEQLRDHNPHRFIVPEAMLASGQAISLLDEVLGRIEGLVAQRKFPYRAVVFDELNSIINPCWSAFKTNYVKPKGEGRPDPWTPFEHWALRLLKRPKAAGLAVGVVMHEDAPKYKENAPAEIQYRGGPRVPFGRLREEVVALSEVRLRIIVRDKKPQLATPPKNGEAPPALVVPTHERELLYQLSTSGEWLGGIRGGFGLPTELPIGQLPNLLKRIRMSVT